MKSDAQAVPDESDLVVSCSISGNDIGTWGLWRLTAGSAFLMLENSNGDKGVCNSAGESEGEKKLVASLRFSVETGLVCVRKI